MKARDPSLKSQIEKESIALFKKNLLKESYNWFKDTDYFEKLKSENKYSNGENEHETKNVVTGRVQLGWGGTFFLLCCVVVICDNSGWQSCNHYNNSIFYSPEALTVVYSILFIVYAFPLFILHQCLGLISQGNYVKSCRMLSSHMGVLSIFSLFGTVTFCAKEICNFSVELLQNVLRIVHMENGEKKYGMTKVFIDLTKREMDDCSLMPDTIYLNSINQCISFNKNVMVNFYENLWFIGNKENYIYIILIATIFILFCYFILLRENFRVFKFFIFVIIVNWISSKSVVIMNTFFFYIPQQIKLYQEVLEIFEEIGIIKLTIFLYGTIARSSSIFILSTFASYFHTNTNILKITMYTFAFYILNMYFYLKNEAHEYYLYNSKNLITSKEFNFIKCNTYINLLQGLAGDQRTEGKTDIPSSYGVTHFTEDDKYAVWQKLCLFFSSYSFLFSTIFIVLMQLLGPFNILMEWRKSNSHADEEDSNEERERKIYTYKSLVKRYERDRINRSVSNNRSSFLSKRGRSSTCSDKSTGRRNPNGITHIDRKNSHKKKKRKKNFFRLNFFFKGRKVDRRGEENEERSLYLSRKSSFLPEKGDYFQEHSAFSNLQNGGEIQHDIPSYKSFDRDPYDFNFGGSSFEDHIGVGDLARENLQGKMTNRRQRQSSTSATQRNGSSNMYADSDPPSWGVRRRALFSDSSGPSASSSDVGEGARWSGESRSRKENSGKGSGGTGVPKQKSDLHTGIARRVAKMKNLVINKYGTFLLFTIIYILTIFHVIDFKRNNDIVSEIILNSLYRGFLIFICAVQVIYASWVFGMKLQMSQCGVFSCLLNFFTWVVVLPLLSVLYLREGTWFQVFLIGLSLNAATVATSFVEVTVKLRRERASNISQKISMKEQGRVGHLAQNYQQYRYTTLFKKCLYWLYIGNLEVLRRNMNIAMSGNDEKYIPPFWTFFLKYINSSMLIVAVIYNTREYFFDMLPMFGCSFSLRIELIAILLIFLGSLAVLANNLRKDHYRPQGIIIPSVPMFCQDKSRYIFSS
ncbi:conserved Plasmodium membrane protein, unknown function [Plasmodium knowlesi strain H]|uniref:Uncharacterized protein n=3 Tax=Plasmodium knowlesi TaxID=5850 RepID=A0A1A7VJM2_PLAKH|nr:conserved Plasmodium membrane protein, unknown function [Plasmodium knowlesi strain H]OTN66016.1 Uncharacterized protein PKNOH_S100054900 [Plasmodium knowlesi]CAA9987907.1 conserved Plasmodium membrane protein, unknown function [Plasmodium knowlesi strain H]SBO22248.1 conserved Plasmodium membrane protein, unknown function [Plasmodium knowlesi strain H]SBO28840.1 conserved Plasmodium membrane protein, unknown function [Plasmodium knowlesi strain H]VVS77381.1 conserved Plasmodium membrane pr